MNIRIVLRKIKATILELIKGKYLEEPHLIFELYNKKSNGTMIDVGAHFGSALMPFAKNGWQVLGFEPDPNNRQVVLANTSTFKNVTIFDQAVSNISGEQLKLYTSNVSTGISSLTKFHDSHLPTAIVTTTTLEDVVKNYQIKSINFLKIDAEGFDLFILKGLNWNLQPHPEAIVCEYENRKTIPLDYTVNDMCSFLTDKGYKLVISEWYPIVEYGQRHQWKQFVSLPEQITDSLAWGNIIAVKPQHYSNLVKLCRKYGPVH